MTNIKKPTGKIYQAYNKITGKSYIGQTVNRLTSRIYYHYYQARDEKRPKHKFQRALNKYNVEDWEWTILESNLSKEEIGQKEKDYIIHFDSYNNGYNSTVGGDGGLSGTAKKHKLFHEDHGWQEMTMMEFRDTYGVNKGQLNQMILGKRRQAKGWCLSIEQRDTPRKKKEFIISTRRVGKKDRHIFEINGVLYKGTYKQISDSSGANLSSIRSVRATEKRSTKTKKFLREDVQQIKYIKTIWHNN